MPLPNLCENIVSLQVFVLDLVSSNVLIICRNKLVRRECILKILSWTTISYSVFPKGFVVIFCYTPMILQCALLMWSNFWSDILAQYECFV